MNLTKVTLDPTTVPTIAADGTGSGDANPYAIVFYPGDTDITIGNTAGKYQFSANGGGSGGNGGGIVVQPYPGSVTLDNSGISAKAQASNGNGGTATVYGDISFAGTGIVIDVTGQGTGTGGTVQMSWNSTTGVDINEVIKVDGGSSLLSSSEQNFGRISINGVTCQQRTISNSYPKTYWNCTNPNSSSANEQIARGSVAGLPYLTTLDNNNVQLYIMDSNWAFNNFFQPTTTIPGVIGYNLPSTYASGGLAVVFEQTGSVIDYSPYYSANFAHEIGHLIDAYASWPSQVPAGTFQTAVASDKINMILATCMDVFNDSGFCAAHSSDPHPWYTFEQRYISPQDFNAEMFAYAFQTCSGFAPESALLDHVETTNQYNTSTPRLYVERE